MNTKKQLSECTNDLDHSWPAEHASWNGGAMDSFVSTHTSAAYEGALGINTMGYYTKADLPFYYALVKKFTVCDNYFCSVLGPTHPNRLMAMTGSIDPAGVAGGPILVTNLAADAFQWTCTWTTMPEVLPGQQRQLEGVQPVRFATTRRIPRYFFSKNMLLYFEQYKDPDLGALPERLQLHGPNVIGGLTGRVGPNHFAADVANDTLPQVSWIVSPQEYDEHPPAPPALGEWYSQQVLNTLLSNPEVWASTVLFIMYDENDGFFDHVPPPTPPAGTAGRVPDRQPAARRRPGAMPDRSDSACGCP